jgi:shikimate kinase
MPHVDVDTRIEERTGRTITEIFRESGEEIFRRHEKNEIRDILGRGRCVVAAGGGTVLDGENVSRMKGSSLVVWLFAGLEETLLRLGTNPSRPLATGKESLAFTFRNRIPVSARASHLLVKTDGASVDEVAERIVYESDSAFGG